MLFANGPRRSLKRFEHYRFRRNVSFFSFLLFFSILMSLTLFLLAQFSGDDIGIVRANGLLFLFSVCWIMVIFFFKNSKRNHFWIFLIPCVVFLIWASYLLGNYLNRSELFATYSTVLFAVAFVYLTRWYITALMYTVSLVYLLIFTKYLQSGPLSFTSVKIFTLINVAITAWIVSRLVFNQFIKEFEAHMAKEEMASLYKQDEKATEKTDQFLKDENEELKEQLDEKDKQIKSLVKDLENSQQSKALFLANMSHEIRTPLAGIIGTLEMLETADLNKDEKRLLNMTRESADQLNHIVNNLIEISRMRSGRYEISFDSFDPERVISEVVKFFTLYAEEKDLEIKRKSTKLPEKLISDPLRIRQIMENLLGNAIKFTEAGRIEIDCSFSGENKTLKLVVEDTGIGIDKEMQKRIFDSFFQGDTSLRKKYRGLGLGLTIVHEIVRKMGGRIKLHSTVGKGTRFVVFIPVQLPEETEVLQRTEKQKKEKRHVKERFKRILIVEDNKVNRFLVRKIVETTGTEIIEAADGKEAVALFEVNDVDAVLMDIQMPLMDGFTALEKIRGLSKGKEIPVIAITGYASKEERETILEKGFDDYISKPFEKNDLLSVLSNY